MLTINRKRQIEFYIIMNKLSIPVTFDAGAALTINQSLSEVKSIAQDTSGAVSAIKQNPSSIGMTVQDVSGLASQLSVMNGKISGKVNNSDATASGIDIINHKIALTSNNLIIKNDNGIEVGNINSDGAITGSFNGDIIANSFQAGKTSDAIYTKLEANRFSFYSNNKTDGPAAFFYWDTSSMNLAVWDGTEYKIINFSNWNSLNQTVRNVGTTRSFGTIKITGEEITYSPITLYYDVNSTNSSSRVYYSDPNLKNLVTANYYNLKSPVQYCCIVSDYIDSAHQLYVFINMSRLELVKISNGIATKTNTGYYIGPKITNTSARLSYSSNDYTYIPSNQKTSLLKSMVWFENTGPMDKKSMFNNIPSSISTQIFNIGVVSSPLTFGTNTCLAETGSTLDGGTWEIQADSY